MDKDLIFVFVLLISSSHFIWVFQRSQGLKRCTTMSDDEREEKELDLSSAEVVTKYKTAAEIVNSLFLTLLMPLWSQILFGFWLFHTLDTIFPGTLLKFIFFNLYFLVLLRFDVFFFLCLSMILQRP